MFTVRILIASLVSSGIIFVIELFLYIFIIFSPHTVDYRSVFRPVTIDRFRVHSMLNRNVCLLRLFPSITIQTVRALLHPPIEGVILQTYGSGESIQMIKLSRLFN